ncbi:spermidine/putrescine ABC transporter permease [Candidatus Riesia pediculicola]|nr:spermidine/putrescine ABC transporter permease [Candidatus Riesia pediculicola]
MIIRFLRNFLILSVYFYLYIPIIILIIDSFHFYKLGSSLKEINISKYELLLKNDSLMQAALNSITISFLSASITTIIGFLISLSLLRYSLKSKFFIYCMLFIVSVSPDIVMAISLLFLFKFIRIPLGFFSLLLSHITFCLPFSVINTYSKMKKFDINLLEAAEDLGASEFLILRYIILPLSIPAIVSSWLLTFIVSIDDVTISSFVTGPRYEILPLKIYSMVKVGISSEINEISILLLLFFMFCFLLVHGLWKIFKKNKRKRLIV